MSKFKPKIFKTDKVLKEMTGGHNYFVPYAEDTKMKTFKSKSEADKFLKKIKRSGY